MTTNSSGSKPRRSALGRGLDALISISDVDPAGSSAIREIPIDNIVPNPDQPRRDFDEESLRELAVSIRELGIVQPLTLRLADDGTHQIIAGERRWRAAGMAGLSTVPAYVRTASDSEVTEMALIENIQREDLNAVEVALAFKKLIDVYHLTQERLSERLGKKRSTVTNHLRLLKLPAEIQLGLRDRKLDMGHARALLSVENLEYQLKLYQRILDEGLSVRKVEELARKGAKPEPSPEKPSTPTPDETEISRKLSDFFPLPVKVKRSPKGKGTVTLSFSSDRELSLLLDFLEKYNSK